MMEDGQVTPPSRDLYITFWRVPEPPFGPSSIAATNTVLFAPSNLAAPRGEPVTCTSRMKLECRITGVDHVVPLSEYVTERARLLMKSFQEIYMRPYFPLVVSLSTHIDSRSSLPPLWAQAPTVQVLPLVEVHRPMP